MSKKTANRTIATLDVKARPVKGGSYIREADGSLTKAATTKPRKMETTTAPPAAAASPDAKKEN